MAAPGVSTAAPRRRSERQRLTLGVLDPLGRRQVRTTHRAALAEIIGSSCYFDAAGLMPPGWLTALPGAGFGHRVLARSRSHRSATRQFSGNQTVLMSFGTPPGADRTLDYRTP